MEYVSHIWNHRMSDCRSGLRNCWWTQVGFRPEKKKILYFVNTCDLTPISHLVSKLPQTKELSDRKGCYNFALCVLQTGWKWINWRRCQVVVCTDHISIKIWMQQCPPPTLKLKDAHKKLHRQFDMMMDGAYGGLVCCTSTWSKRVKYMWIHSHRKCLIPTSSAVWMVSSQLWPQTGFEKQDHPFSLCSSHWQHKNEACITYTQHVLSSS